MTLQRHSVTLQAHKSNDMPELPEVETTKTSLKPLLQQQVTGLSVYQPKLRWQMPKDLSRLTGRQLSHVARRAKYLLLHFATTPTIPSDSGADTQSNAQPPTQLGLIIHLGMSGSLQQYPLGDPKRKHDHLILSFTDTQLHYHDPRRFGAVVWQHQHGDKLLSHLGVEPLDAGFDGDYLYAYIHRLPQLYELHKRSGSHRPQRQGSRRAISRAIKSVIMDQAVVVGVGNIYATESLYLARIHPATPAHLLSREQLHQLACHIQAILRTAIDQGGSTLRDFTVASGQTGYFQQTLHAYGRAGEACPVCQSTLTSIKINARASVYCPQCQPL